MKISFSAIKHDNIDAIAIGVTEDKTLTATGKTLDKELNSLIKRALDGSRFEGKAGQSCTLITPDNIAYRRVVVYGMGKGKKLDSKTARKIGGAISKQADANGIKHLHIVAESPKGCTLDDAAFSSEIAYGALLKSFRFDKYFTRQKDEQKPTLTKLTIMLDDHSAAKKSFATYEAINSGVTLTRELVSEPGNIIYPESYAARLKELTAEGLEVEVLDEKAMKKLGMGALLGVGQGSSRESRIVIMRWNGGKKGDAPVAIVGKGVTFDTGGISIKPAGGMEDMKWDMGGSATTAGLMKALAARKAKVNVVGVVGLVENMPDGNAQRPGDVVTSMSGQTIEVINTDAEGRLVLADALWYTQDRFKPQCIVDLATLTGAILIGLGDNRAGLFSNNDKLAKQLFDTGEAENERVWRFPIGDEYESHIKSDIADMKNVGKSRLAGSISAAQFLSRFVNDVPWAHLDIAGVAWSNEEWDTNGKGATGFGVRLLNRWISEHYES
ncbi:MAG: leucyl aminopeptidase [Alphaproteobacteria bacterium]|nr:leucyl aminopeptidase [Alphaproteobacteria bacterium]